MRRYRHSSHLAALATMLLGALLFVAQAVPDGLTICFEADGRVHLEVAGDPCCKPLASVGPSDRLSDVPKAACTACEDLALPHQPAPLIEIGGQFPQHWNARPLIALIAWPRAHRSAPPELAARRDRTHHLLGLATVVIRC